MPNWETKFNEIYLWFQNHPTTLLILFAWLFWWKGLALWRAARQSSKNWFIILLLVNTLGILEIIYLFFVTKGKIWRGGADEDNAKPPENS